MKTEIIAEIGSVHDGSFGNALKLIEAAAASGASIVKFQTHIADAETLSDAPSPGYFKDESRIDYFNRTAFNLTQWKAIKAKAIECGVGFLSSPFSLEAVDLLEEIGVDIYKIPSGEVTNLPLLEYVVKTGKPIIVSSGMSDWAELDAAVEILKESNDLTVMQCTSEYPCPLKKAGLNIISEIRDRYNVKVGFSDHTESNTACIASVVLGVSVVEKHFTFSKLMYGSDAKNAAEPKQFSELSFAINELDIMNSNPVDKDNIKEYKNMKDIFEKSIVAKHNLTAGHTICFEDLAFKKPGTGISASKYKDIIGKVILTNLDKNYLLSEDDFK